MRTPHEQAARAAAVEIQDNWHRIYAAGECTKRIANIILRHFPAPTLESELSEALRKLRAWTPEFRFTEPSHKGPCTSESSCDAICMDNSYAAEGNALLSKVDKLLARYGERNK